MYSKRKSVSPFGLTPKEKGPFEPLKNVFHSQLQKEAEEPLRPLKSWDEAITLPYYLEKVFDSAANDAPEILSLCQYALKYWPDLEEKVLSQPVTEAFEKLFDKKTDLFLIDHHDKESCEKLGWPEEYRDVTLFSKERDTLAGCFFGRFAEKSPEVFSGFIQKWVGSSWPDRLLHFLDFAAGSKNPTFEHYLLFSDPSLSRILKDKDHLRFLLDKAQPLLAKLKSPTWEKDVRAALALS